MHCFQQNNSFIKKEPSVWNWGEKMEPWYKTFIHKRLSVWLGGNIQPLGEKDNAWVKNIRQVTKKYMIKNQMNNIDNMCWEFSRRKNHYGLEVEVMGLPCEFQPFEIWKKLIEKMWFWWNTEQDWRDSNVLGRPFLRNYEQKGRMRTEYVTTITRLVAECYILPYFKRRWFTVCFM